MDDSTIPALVEKLCRSLTLGKCSETSKEFEQKYKLALQIISSRHLTLQNHDTEFSIVQTIRKYFAGKERYQDGKRFDELYTRLTASPILKNRKAVLELMFYLASQPQSAVSEPQVKHSFTLPALSTLAPEATYSKSTSKTSFDISLCPASTPQFPLKSSTLYAHTGVSYNVLLREIIYAFQGIQGQVFQWDASHEHLLIKPSIHLTTSSRSMVLSLIEMGWLFYKVSKFCEAPKNESSCGLAARAFSAALQDELSEYYRLLAVLQAQLDIQMNNALADPNTPEETHGLTLHRLLVWTKEPRARLIMLVHLVEACHGLRGGALASAIHSFTLRGNTILKAVAENILVKVCRPLYEMLMLWTFEGELRDPYGEFFVGLNMSVDVNSLWNDKYYERAAMVPVFFTEEQAHQVATTGKSICFLREICLDKSRIPGLTQIREQAEERSESLLSLDWESIEQAYATASEYLLQVLLERYQVKTHLCALRQYLLLGQGDFVNYLMKLVEPELDKPATPRLSRVLASILDKCIRSTNSQYDDPEVIKRMDVRISEPSQGDTGWDVFTLDYKVDGPLGTILTPEVKARYETLFYALWRSKRMEWITAKLRHQQLTDDRALRGLPEAQAVLHQAQLLLSEMIHFAQEMSHYLSFEVVACAWEQLSIALRSAKTMDQLLAAHEHFLQTVTSRALLDEDSKEMRDLLRGIHEAMLQFSQIQERLYAAALLEVENRQMMNSESNFESVLPTIKAKMSAIGASYQSFVQTFLLMLSSHTDTNLQGLSVRLDFNEYYQRKDSRLSMSLTFSYRRMTINPCSN